MEFALLFILAFLAGLLIYRIDRKWIPSVLIPMGFFLVTTLADQEAKDAQTFSLVFGLPIVFFASLLGAYVLQIRTVEPEIEEPSSTED